MRIAALVAASVIAIGMAAAGNSLQAAPLLPQLETNQSLAQQVGWRYRRHCVRCATFARTAGHGELGGFAVA